MESRITNTYSQGMKKLNKMLSEPPERCTPPPLKAPKISHLPARWVSFPLHVQQEHVARVVVSDSCPGRVGADKLLHITRRLEIVTFYFHRFVNVVLGSVPRLNNTTILSLLLYFQLYLLVPTSNYCTNYSIECPLYSVHLIPTLLANLRRFEKRKQVFVKFSNVFKSLVQMW